MREFLHSFETSQSIVCRVACEQSNGVYGAVINPSINSIINDPTRQDHISFQASVPENALFTGDVVQLEPSGRGIVLYEIHSSSNAILLTEMCNCRCLICPQPPGNDSQDNVRVSLETIALLDGQTESLGITGGEPTLQWSGLITALKTCKEFIPNARIDLLTNARVLKDYSKARAIAEECGPKITACVPVYSDISKLHDEITQTKGSFWETLEGIYNLERAGMAVELRTVITKLNYKRFSQWAEFIYKTFPFVQNVALMGMEPIGYAYNNREIVWIDPIEYAPLLEKSIKVLHRRGMNVSVYNHQLCLLQKSYWRFSRKSISEWKNIYMPECQECAVRAECGGFFQSSTNIKRNGIKPL